MEGALLTRAVLALERIAKALEIATTAEPAPTGCQHPPELRVDFSAGPTEEWHCKGCGFRYVSEPAEVIGG